MDIKSNVKISMSRFFLESLSTDLRVMNWHAFSLDMLDIARANDFINSDIEVSRVKGDLIDKQEGRVYTKETGSQEIASAKEILWVYTRSFPFLLYSLWGSSFILKIKSARDKEIIKVLQVVSPAASLPCSL
jgi:hypothetical protein